MAKLGAFIRTSALRPTAASAVATQVFQLHFVDVGFQHSDSSSCNSNANLPKSAEVPAIPEKQRAFLNDRENALPDPLEESQHLRSFHGSAKRECRVLKT
jgi:hypothetical protein